MSETKEKNSSKKIIIMTGAVIASAVLLALLVIYFGKVNFYKTHFLPNTIINGMDCSKLDAETVAEMLNTQAKEYTLSVLGRDVEGNSLEIGVINGIDIERKITDALSEANALLEQQKPESWFLTGNKTFSYSLMHSVTFDETLLKKQVEAFDACQKENMTAPCNAYISEYMDEIGGCEIIPEVMGTQLDVKKAVASINAAVYSCAETVDLVEQECYEGPEVLATDEKLLASLEKLNKWLETEITYDWNTFEVVVDKDTIKDWILRDGSEAELDEEAIAAFVAENAKKYDTYGKNRKFTTTLGVDLTLPTGKFGWKTDRDREAEELLTLIEEGKVTKREPVYSHTAPRHGMDDIGSSFVEADLSNQHLYLYYKGDLVFETDFVSGSFSSTPDCVTPQGVFGITYKKMNAVLKGNGYETPVTYWMPFYGNYGMHDATWRTEFGGDIFITNGSHGCINLPLDSAATIYSYVYEGYPVICYYY